VSLGSSIRACDPLLSLTLEVAGSRNRHYGETVNSAPLVTGWAALQQHLTRCQVLDRYQQRVNRSALVQMACAAGWSPIEPASEFRTGIMLIRAPRGPLRQLTSAMLAARFQEAGVA